MLKRADQETTRKACAARRGSGSVARDGAGARRWPGAEDVGGFTPRQQQVLTAALEVLVEPRATG